MCFDEKALCNKSTWDKSLMRLPKSPNSRVSASGVSSFHKKMFLNYDVVDIGSKRTL